MAGLGLAIDLGTSGFRAQAVDLSSGAIVATAVTVRHPLPGDNVIDHLHYALLLGVPLARSIVVRAVNRLIRELGVPTAEVERLAVCGNPTQLSLFQGMEIRDLAYSGQRKLVALGVVSPQRAARVATAEELPGLELRGGCEVIVPPAVCHEVGADALALIMQTRMLEKGETAIAIDFGTNAEMALLHQGRIITGSTAAGPAIEGQHLSCGVLAMPGAIVDLKPEGGTHRLVVLDAGMLPVEGALVDLRVRGANDGDGAALATGISGTGTIAALSEGLRLGLVVPPRIRTPDGALHLGHDLVLTEEDLLEAGKAIGAVRAGHIALCHEAGIALPEVRAAYLAGASGTYVDAIKALGVGMIPPRVATVYQGGNTSLAMARTLLCEPRTLDAMSALADRLRRTHCLFASSDAFRKLYILELSHWAEGLPLVEYRRFLKRYGLPDLVPPSGTPTVVRTVERDIDELGPRGLAVVQDLDTAVALPVEGCTGCLSCVEICPMRAIAVDRGTEPPTIIVQRPLCRGVACRRCERVCPARVFKLDRWLG